MLLLAQPHLKLSVSMFGQTLVFHECDLTIKSQSAAPVITLDASGITRLQSLAQLADLDVQRPAASLQWPEWHPVLSLLLAPTLEMTVNGAPYERRHMAQSGTHGPAFMPSCVREVVFEKRGPNWAVGWRPGERQDVLSGWARYLMPHSRPDLADCLHCPLSGSGDGSFALYRLEEWPQRRPSWYFLQDGFIVDKLELPRGLFRVQAFVEASELRMDASFVRAVRDARWDAALEDALEEAKAFLSTCQRLLPQISPTSNSLKYFLPKLLEWQGDWSD